MPDKLQNVKNTAKFTVGQVISSEKYKSKADLLSVLLNPKDKYSLAEVDKKIADFMKGSAK